MSQQREVSITILVIETCFISFEMHKKLNVLHQNNIDIATKVKTKKSKVSRELFGYFLFRLIRVPDN